MTISIELFDGTILEFPDGTPDDVIDRVAREETLALQADGSASMATPSPGSPPPMEGPLPPPRADAPATPYAPAPLPKDTFGGPALEMAEGPFREASRYSGGIMDTSKSPSYAALRRDVPGMHPALAATLSKFGDVSMATLNLAGAGIAGGAGLLAEAVPFLDDAGEKELAQSALTASQFAVPELAGVSSTAKLTGGAAARATNTPKVAAANLTKEQLDALANKAARGGMGSVKATEELAAAAKLNPEAKAAADRLGIELPADVFSDDAQFLEMTGQTRGIAGSEASATWMRVVNAAKAKADEIMDAMDGSPDLASLSDEVKTSVTATRDGLKTEAKKLYGEVDAAVPPSTPVVIDNSTKLLNKEIEDLGGISRLSTKQKELYNLVTNPNERPTYAGLQLLKEQVGEALSGFRDSIYSGSFSSRTLNRLYGSLSEDQKATVAAVGDAALVDKLKAANQLTAKQKALEKRITTAYGGEVDGSIGMKLREAVNTGAKGDIAALTRILKLIPDDLKGKAVATALSNMARQVSGANAGTFGIPQFVKMWAGIQTNKPVMNMIGQALGPEKMAVLNDLANVTRRIEKSDRFVLGTGKANQALKSPLARQGLLGRIADTSFGERAGRAIGTTVGMATGGLAGAIVGSEGVSAILQSTKKNVLGAVGSLLNSNEFLEAAVEVASKGQMSGATGAKLANSKGFAAWAKSIGRSPVDLIRELTGNPAGVAVGAGAAQPQNDKPWMQLEGRY